MTTTSTLSSSMMTTSSLSSFSSTAPPTVAFASASLSTKSHRQSVPPSHAANTVFPSGLISVCRTAVLQEEEELRDERGGTHVDLPQVDVPRAIAARQRPRRDVQAETKKPDVGVFDRAPLQHSKLGSHLPARDGAPRKRLRPVVPSRLGVFRLPHGHRLVHGFAEEQIAEPSHAVDVVVVDAKG